MKIKKALVTAAGFGTSFLPITKTIQKEMLPILNRPTIDYIVQDCLLAGVEEIIFVVKESETHLIEHYYSESEALKRHLNKFDKMDRYYQTKEEVFKDVKFRFITQKTEDDYGTAIPVKLAKPFLENEEAFLVFMGDDFVYNPGTVGANEMIKLLEQSHSQALITCIQKPESELHRYGVAEVRKSNNYQFLTNLVEKPAPGTVQSNLVNISNYILTNKVFELLTKLEPNPQSGEYYITDVVSQLATDSSVVVYIPQGEYLDGGNVLNWLKANLIVAKDDPELGPALREFVRKEF